MSSTKGTSKTVISIGDEALSYITLNRNEYGFFVEGHETVELPEETIVRGEILKADLLYRILKKLAKQIKDRSVDIILPHDYFLCADGELDQSSANQPFAKRVANYFQDVANTEPWHKTHVCEFSGHEVNGKDKVLFKCLPKDIQKSYVHVFKKSGFKVISLGSDLLAFDHLLDTGRVSLVAVGAEAIRVAEFKEGMYGSHKTFQASYGQFLDDIMTNLDISEDDAWDILEQYGLLRAHREEKVYKRLVRSISPLIEFMSKRKIKEQSSVRVVFFDLPIPGFNDLLKRSLNVEVGELDVLKTDRYTFQDILTIHKDESYQYQALIAQALKHYRDLNE